MPAIFEDILLWLRGAYKVLFLYFSTTLGAKWSDHKFYLPAAS